MRGASWPNPEHLKILQQGVDVWNEGRVKGTATSPDLSEANFSGAKLSRANFSGANLSRANLNLADLHEVELGGANLRGANLRGANLNQADLREADLDGANLRGANLRAANLNGAHLTRAVLFMADLRGANLSAANLIGADLHQADLFGTNLSGANLSGTNLTRADLRGANLSGANLRNAVLWDAKLGDAILVQANLGDAQLGGATLSGADLSMADLRKANLSKAVLVEADLTGALLTGCNVYGVSAWNMKLSSTTKQQDLVITAPNEPQVTVDDIEVAQFVYLLLHNEKIRDVIDTITSKVVLLLGRFTPERKTVLDALREELRKRSYVPVLFDFDVPDNRDITETVTLLARMARFIIADLTDPSSIPKELEAIVPQLAVPVQPLLEGDRPYAMFKDYWKYDWVLPVLRYESLTSLLGALADKVIAPAETKMNDLAEKRRTFEAELIRPR
jgi:uncharacterized protein YjbI with pentapeptide repeats